MQLVSSGVARTSLALVDSPGVTGNAIVTVPARYGLAETMHLMVSSHRHVTTDPFYVLHLSHVTALVDDWARNLPPVEPFYAVKCNPSPCLLGALAALGAGFDCASQVEMETILALEVSPDRIVYANPCKPEHHVKYAANVGVNVTTFDSVHELDKISRSHPMCDLLIRIKAPDEDGSRIQLGSKYGALLEEIEPLLQAARSASLPVIGVSFHVGSGAKKFSTYERAIAAARSVFDTAARLGTPPMSVLDIGGGFTAGQDFTKASSAVMDAIKTHFPDHAGSGLRIIAEPGRYFAESAFTLAANIIGKRVRRGVREYWINDGVYGSMDPRLCEFGSLKCLPLACGSNPKNATCDGAATFTSTMFGPTCDAADTVLTGIELPELEVGDWVVFPRMGAYSAATLGCDFNGFNGSDISTYVVR